MNKEKFDKVKYDSDYKQKNYKRAMVLIPRNQEEFVNFIYSHQSVSKYFLELAKKDFENSKK